MLKHYIEKVSTLEFSERNAEIPVLLSELKGGMNARGVLNSTITLKSISDFFAAEYLVRCDFLKEFILNHPNLLGGKSNNDKITNAKTLFYNLATDEKDKIISLYKSATSSILESLLNKGMMQQIEDDFLKKIKPRIEKNNLYIEIAYKEITMAEYDKNHVVIFQPNVYGIGVNINEIWNRFFK